METMPKKRQEESRGRRMINMVLEKNITNRPTQSSEMNACQPITEDTPVIFDNYYCNNNEFDFDLTENSPIILNIDSTLTVNSDDKNDTFTNGLNLSSLDFTLEKSLDGILCENIAAMPSSPLESSVVQEEVSLHVKESSASIQCNLSDCPSEPSKLEGTSSFVSHNSTNKELVQIDENCNNETEPDNIDVRNQQSDKCYLDDIDQNRPTEDECSSEKSDDQSKKRKRVKRHQVNPLTWKVNRWKENRKLGNEYVGRKKNEDGKYVYDIKKSARGMKQRCKCKRKDGSSIQCATLTEDERKQNFDEYWKMEWSAKKVFVRLLTRKSSTARARDRKVSTTSRRNNSCQYFLKKGGQIVRVCKTMFLNTLSIGEWTALNWQKENKSKKNNSSDDEDLGKENEQASKKTRKLEEVQSLEIFFSTMPKVESHYCRKRTSNLYIEPSWQSKNELFLFYKNDWCLKKNVAPLSVCRLLQYFEDNNLSLFQPKKDACDCCESFKSGNVTTEEYQAHILRKDEARVEKELDKENPTCFTFTMDLQSLLLCPRSNVSSLYYKMKLSVHNFTIFNLGTKEGFCFLWNETEGGLSSNEFSTILSYFFSSQLPLPEGKDKIVLYSDGCSYQNRCSNLSNALLHISSTKIVIIEQKFLEVGHTQMEADAMHSCIERKLKHKKINVPADYITVCKEARKNPAPYNVQYLDHLFFKNFDKHSFYSSIRPGRGVGSPRVVDIRGLRYLPDPKLQYKLNFSDDWQDIPQRKNKSVKPTNHETFPALYEGRIPIKKRKFDDLQELKSIMEADYHGFYNNLPYC